MSRSLWTLASVLAALLAGWGVASAAGASSRAVPGSKAAQELDLVPPAPAKNDEVAELRQRIVDLEREVATLRGERDESRLEVGRLRTELSQVQERRLAQQQQWSEYMRAITELAVPESVGMPKRPLFLPEPEIQQAFDAAEAFEAEAARQAAARSELARHDLNALLMAEHVFTMDVLEMGVLNDGWAGPVVVRLLDDRGRMIGTLAADRFRLEASRSGRSVALVFEIGWESHGGVRVPFGPPEEEGSGRGGTRRVHLPGVDPGPWIESLPELLRAEDLLPTPDDGRWNLIELRLVLDERLRSDSPSGRWRLVSLGGVLGGDLLDVHLAETDKRGRVVRRLFADKLRVRPRGKGLELILHDGVIEKDDEKAPFLDGRYQLFLPAAKPEVWTEAGVPGLSRPPQR